MKLDYKIVKIIFELISKNKSNKSSKDSLLINQEENIPCMTIGIDPFNNTINSAYLEKTCINEIDDNPMNEKCIDVFKINPESELIGPLYYTDNIEFIREYFKVPGNELDKKDRVFIILDESIKKYVEDNI